MTGYRVQGTARLCAAVCAALLIGIGPGAGHSQDPPPPAAPASQGPQQPTFRAKVDLVLVDVSVTGRDDEAVSDLKPADFEVQEDGIPQQVQTLQLVRLDGTRTSDTDESLEIRGPEHAALEAARDDVRLFAIFLDDYHVDKKPDITLPLRQTLQNLVRQFGPNDLIAVMDPLTPLSHLRFTRRRDELLERMGEFEGRRGQLFPVRSALEEGQLTRKDIWEVRASVTLSALEALVTHLGGLREGRKSVLFVSQGPPLGYVGSPNESRLKDVLQAANRANVTVHVFDPRPLGRAPFGGSDVLQRLSHETGGRAIVNVNMPLDRLTQVIDDASAYYLLGYSPSRELADGKFHRIEVDVKRRGVRVLARRGYWAPTAEERNPKVVERAVEPGLAEALSDLVEPKGGRVADVFVGASRTSDSRTRLTIAWEPSGRGDAKRATLLSIVRVKGNGGAALGDPHSIAAVGATGKNTTATLDMEGGREVTLRFTAQTADGAVLDQWDQTLTAPALADDAVALSTPRFLRARSAFEARAMDAGQDPAPAASRRFRRSDRVLVDVECYVTGTDVPTLSARLLNSYGEPLSDVPAPPLSGGRTRFSLPLAGLAPSTYILRLEARAGEHTVQQRTAFRVVP